MKNVFKNLSVAAALLMGLTANAQHSYTGVTSGMTYYECADYISNSFTVTLPAGAVTSNWVIDNTYSIALGTTNYAGNNFHIYSTTTNSIQFTATDLAQHEIAVEYKVGTTSGQVFFYVDAYTTQISGPTTFCSTAGATYTEGGSAPTECPGTAIWSSSNSSLPINSSTGKISATSLVGSATTNITLSLAGVCPAGSPSATATVAVTELGNSLVEPYGFQYEQMKGVCEFNAAIVAVPGAQDYVWNGGAPSTSYIYAGGFSPLSTYTTRVYATNSCGAVSPTLTVTKETPNTTGVCKESPIKPADGSIAYAFKLYPTPANDHITVEYTAPSDNTTGVNLDIYDMLGKKVTGWVLSANSNTVTEEVSGLNKGMYIYVLTSGDNILERGKLMIQR